MKKYEWRQVKDKLHVFGDEGGWRGQVRSLCGLHSIERSKEMEDVTLEVCKTCDKLGGKKVKR